MEDPLEKYKEEFNQYLDENGDIVIGTFSMAPSVILEAMDDESYKEQLIEFAEEKIKSQKENVITYFPAPIAHFYERTINSAENEHHQFQLLRSTWESIIYILFAVLLGEIHKRNFGLSTIRLFNNQSIRNNHNGTLSDRLGWKMEFISKVIEYDNDNNETLKMSNHITEDHINILKELNDNRNSYSHIAALSPNQVKERFDLILPKLENLLFDLSFLETVSIIRFRQSTTSPNKIKFNRFDGFSLREVNYEKDFSMEEFSQLMNILDANNVLMEFDNEFFCVSPFLHFYNENNSQRVKICYFKKVNRDTNLWTFELIADNQEEVEIDPATFTYNINDHLAI